MKFSQHTTSAPIEPSLNVIGTWVTRLHQLHQQCSPRFARPETRQHMLLYLQANLKEAAATLQAYLN